MYLTKQYIPEPGIFQTFNRFFPTITSRGWACGAYGNDEYSILGDSTTNNRVCWSSGGGTFTAVNDLEGDFKAVAFGNGKFVAVGTSIIATSTTGRAYTTTSTSFSPDAIAFGNGVFVAMNGTNIIRSVDGVTWTSYSVSMDTSFHQITYGNGFFIASSLTVTKRSADGITWATLTMPGTTRDVVYGRNGFIASSNGGRLYRSTNNGTSWNLVFTTSDPGVFIPNYLARLGDGYVALEDNPAAYLNNIYYSLNGIDWFETGVFSAFILKKKPAYSGENCVYFAASNATGTTDGYRYILTGFK